MQWRGFIIGMLVGGMTVGSIYFLSDIARLFNQGPQVTELVEMNAVLSQENSVLIQMAEADWVGLTADEAGSRLKALGLVQTSSGSDGIATGSINLKLADGQVVEIQAHCARVSASDCATEGVNRNAD